MRSIRRFPRRLPVWWAAWFRCTTSGDRARGRRGKTWTASSPEYSNGGLNYLFPADWATIYDLNSLYAASVTGKGTTIAVVGRSNITLSDVATFRTTAGLAANQPTVVLVNTNPGLVSGDQDEATLDVEWSGATAPGAAVKFVVAASTATSDGVDLSAQYIVNHNTGTVMSTSYGSCEQDMGSAELAFYNGLWQQAAAEGISAFVSSGDAGAAGCYSGSATTASGTGVNGLCSSQYSTCVGGTEFNEGASSAKYWSTTNNASNEGSALSYIPEKVWNESSTVTGGSGLWSSGGGASVVYAQPTWQKGVAGTAAANGMRAVPDIAMSAAGHDGYIIVENGSFYSIAGTSAASPSFAGLMALLVQARGGTGQGNANPGLYALAAKSSGPFHPTPSGNNSVPGVTGFTASGGTYNLATGLGSVDGAALVNAWGSPLTTTNVDFSMSESAGSGSATAGGTAKFTVSVTESGSGKSTVALTAKAPTGVTVSISPASIAPGATATVTLSVASTTAVGVQTITVTGTDATGTQSVSYALTVSPPPTMSLTAGASTVTLVQGASGPAAFTIATGGSFTGAVSLSLSGLPSGVTATWSANPVTPTTASTSATLTLAAGASAVAGTTTLTVTATGDGLTATSKVTLQVTQAPSFTLVASPASASMQSLGSTTVTVTATPVGSVGKRRQWIEHQRGFRVAKGSHGELERRIGDRVGSSCMDADADGEFNGRGGNGNAGADGEGCAKDRRNGGDECKSSVDCFTDGACAFSGRGIGHGQRGTGQDGGGRCHIDRQRGLQRGGDLERDWATKRCDGIVEFEWDYACQRKRQLDVNTDGVRIGDCELDAGDCDSDRRWSDSNEHGDDPSAAGGGIDHGAECCIVVNGAYEFRTDNDQRDPCGWVETDRHRSLGERDTGRSDSGIWAGKPLECGSLQRAHYAEGQLGSEDGQLERERSGFDGQHWKSERTAAALYDVADIHIDAQVSRSSLK